MYWILSATCLYLTSFLCVLGILDEDILDNVIERLGMGLLVLGCMGRAKYVTEHEMVDPTWLTVHVGMAVYAVGGALRIALRRLREHGNKTLLRLDAWLLARRTAHTRRREAKRATKRRAQIASDREYLSESSDVPRSHP